MSDELEEMLLEAKDTSELMIDLAYSSLLYSNREIASEVLHMEEMVDEITGAIQEKAIEVALSDKDVVKALATIRLAKSMEEISDAALQIADVVLRDVEIHPVIQMSLRDSDVIITTAQVAEDSSLAGHTLGELRLASQSGMWVIAIRRGRKYIYGPDETTEIGAGDLLFARGPEDAEQYFKDLALGKEHLEATKE